MIVVFLVPPCMSRQFAAIIGQHRWPPLPCASESFLVWSLSLIPGLPKIGQKGKSKSLVAVEDSFIHSFIHSCIHSFMHSFMHSFIHSFIQLILNPSTRCRLKQSSLCMDQCGSSCCASSDVISTVLFLGNFHSWGPCCMGPVSLQQKGWRVLNQL